MNVIFVYNNGRERRMNRRFAHILTLLGYGQKKADAPTQPPQECENLERMTRQELLDLARNAGLCVHHATGKRKLIEAISGI